MEAHTTSRKPAPRLPPTMRPTLTSGHRRLKLASGLVHQRLAVGDVEHPRPDAPGVADGGDGLAGAGGMFQERDGLALAADRIQPVLGLLLVEAQIQREGGAALLGQEVGQLDQPGDTLQEQLQLALHPVRLPGELAVGPAEDLPAVVDQAVLAVQVVLELVEAKVRRGIVAGPVDLEGDHPPGRLEGEVDEARRAVDVQHRVLGGQELGLLDAEDLGKQLDEGVLRAAGLGGAQVAALVWLRVGHGRGALQ